MNNREEELFYTINSLLDSVLYLSGVKRENLEKAAQFYIDNIDDVLSNSNAQGMDEVIEVIEYMKQKCPEFFK